MLQDRSFSDDYRFKLAQHIQTRLKVTCVKVPNTMFKIYWLQDVHNYWKSMVGRGVFFLGVGVCKIYFPQLVIQACMHFEENTLGRNHKEIWQTVCRFFGCVRPFQHQGENIAREVEPFIVDAAMAGFCNRFGVKGTGDLSCCGDKKISLFKAAYRQGPLFKVKKVTRYVQTQCKK